MNSNSHNNAQFSDIVYFLSNADVQLVAECCLDRELTDRELVEVREELRTNDWFDWSCSITALLRHRFGRGDDCPF